MANTAGATISFTLPISCQICLGKVKRPVVCPNQHAFCESCLKVWLERNSKCPACRIDISEENPYRRVIGGLNDDINISENDGFSTPEMRRARVSILVKDYEDEILNLENQIKDLKEENIALKNDNEALKSENSELKNSSSTSSNAGNTCNKHFKDSDKHENINVLALMNKRLKELSQQNDTVKKDYSDLNQKYHHMTDEQVNMVRENQRLRLEIANRSPQKFGRFTVAALEKRCEKFEHENRQLKKALENSDHYIEDIETELRILREFKNNFDKIQPIKVETLDDVDSGLTPRIDSLSPNNATGTRKSPTTDFKGLKLTDLESPLPAKKVSPAKRSLIFSDIAETSHASKFLDIAETGTGNASKLFKNSDIIFTVSDIKFSDELNLTMTPEINDCMLLLSEAERKVEKRRSQDSEKSPMNEAVDAFSLRKDFLPFTSAAGTSADLRKSPRKRGLEKPDLSLESPSKASRSVFV